MLKSGKLKLADDMIVTAQEAANKAETVFTIYDDTTNTQIASGPIGGGGGGEDEISFKLSLENTVNDEEIMRNLALMVTSAYANGVGGTYLLQISQNSLLGVPMEEDDTHYYNFIFNSSPVKTLRAEYLTTSDNVPANGYYLTLSENISYDPGADPKITFQKTEK